MNLAKISAGICSLKLSGFIQFEENYLMSCSFFFQFKAEK
jgi:hypothetical protein